MGMQAVKSLARLPVYPRFIDTFENWTFKQGISGIYVWAMWKENLSWRFLTEY